MFSGKFKVDFFDRNITQKIVIKNFNFSERNFVQIPNNLDWSILSENTNIIWSDSFLIRFKDRWDYEILCHNPSVKFTEKTLDQLKDKLCFNWIAAYCRNTSWTIDLIEKHRELLSWDAISSANISDLNENYLRKNVEFIDWNNLSGNKEIPWSIEMIAQFENYWDWQALYYNEGIVFNKELPELFPDKGRWDFIIKDYTDPEELIGEWPWWRINNQLNLGWTSELIRKYSSHINFHTLSKSCCVSWSEELIEEYKDKWLWSSTEFGGSLSHNPYLPWTYELIKRFEEKWEWGRETTTGIKSNLYYWGLLDLWEIPWSIDFLNEYKGHFESLKNSPGLQYHVLRNQGIWEKVYKGYITDEVVNDLLKVSFV